MENSKKLWIHVNPFTNWPYRFYAMWFSATMPMFIFVLALLTLLPFGIGNDASVFTLYFTATLVLCVHANKFLYVERTWWQSFKMYGAFWSIVVVFGIIATLVAHRFNLV